MKLVAHGQDSTLQVHVLPLQAQQFPLAPSCRCRRPATEVLAYRRLPTHPYRGEGRRYVLAGLNSSRTSAPTGCMPSASCGSITLTSPASVSTM